jgi:DNA polymerase-3 subunit beta
LLRAVSQAQSVVERRNTIPILANVLIEAEGDTVSVSAPPISTSRWSTDPRQVERAGRHHRVGRHLHEIVRKLPDGALVS